MRVLDQEATSRFGRLAKAAVSVSMLALLTACPGKDKASSDASQIVAQVNDSEISIHQVQSRMEMQPGLVSQMGEAAASQVLDGLIEQELAAQAARKAGLDNTPRVLQAMELAKREVLARAYQDQLADKATLPDTTSVDRYYDEHPELFAHRKQYTLLETQVKGTPEQTKALASQVEAVGSADALKALLAESGLPYSSRSSMLWAEAVPMDVLPKLAFLRAGQSIGVVKPEGLVIVTVLAFEEAPVTQGVAQKSIQAAMMNNKRKQLVKQGMDVLKQNAKIERKGAFAAGAASSSGAASTAP